MAYTEFYCNHATGHNNNGGSDENASPAYTHTNGNWNATTGVYTPTSGDPSASVSVGDYASVFNDGTPTTAVFIGRVTAVDSTTITISTTAKIGTAPTTNATGRSINVGGCWKGPNGADPFPFSSIVVGSIVASSSDPARINLKNNDVYDITAGLTPSGSDGLAYAGYNTTPGDEGRAEIDGGTSGASYTMLAAEVGLWQDLEFRNNGATGSAAAITTNSETQLLRVVVHDVRGYGFQCTNGRLVACEAYNCNQSNTAELAGFFSGSATLFDRCFSHDNNRHGFKHSSSSTQAYFRNCIAARNTENGFESALIRAACGPYYSHCDAYDNGQNGIELVGNVSASYGVIINCNLVWNTLYGINYSTVIGNSVVALINNGFGTGSKVNGSGPTNTTPALQEIVPSFNYPSGATPWADPDNGDFTIAHADAKNSGDGSFLQIDPTYTGTVGYPDMGAAQHRGGPIIIQRPRRTM